MAPPLRGAPTPLALPDVSLDKTTARPHDWPPVPFFLILPLWLLAVAVGAVMICTRRLRRAGIYVVTTSTFATLVSFALSTVVLFVGPRVTTDPPGWFGSVVLLVYLAAIPAGGLIGAIAGVLLTHKLLPKVRAP